MIAATRHWFRRNRTGIAVGAGIIGAGYLAGQYALGKIREARERMSEERIAKENLRRRFEQNQDDCTYTVLALLPTIKDEIVGALPVEQITEQLQQERQERLKRLGASEAASSEFPSAPASVADDASLQSGSYIHASQVAGSSSEGGLKPKRSKAQLWQDMKINSIARALTLLYTLSLLTLLTRIQLNLLGRRTYLSSVVSLATPPQPTSSSTISLENRDDDNYDDIYGNDFETNRKFLTFSWWLLHRGSRQLMDRVLAVVKEVFGQVNIREDITLERLGALIIEVRKKIEGASEEERRQKKWLSYLLPPKEQETFVIRQASSPESDESPSPESTPTEDPMTSTLDVEITSSLRRLLDETADLIDSPTFSHVQTLLLDAAFSHLVDVRIMDEAFRAPPQAGADPSISELKQTCKLAHILPVFCRQAHAIVASGSADLDSAPGMLPTSSEIGNDYLTSIDRVPDLEAFAAVIYSSNFEFEVTGGIPDQAEKPVEVTHEVPVDMPEDASKVMQGIDESALTTETVESPVLESNTVVPVNEQDDLTAQGVDLESAWKKALDKEDGVDPTAADE